MVASRKEFPVDPELLQDLHDADVEEIQASLDILSYRSEAELATDDQLRWFLIDFVVPDSKLAKLTRQELEDAFVDMMIQRESRSA